MPAGADNPHFVMDLFMIDGIGAFFRGCPRRRINWSKIPFDNLERDGRLDRHTLGLVTDDFTTFVKSAAEIGFNAVTLDDVAHLAPRPEYPDSLNARIGDYRDAYARFFEIAQAHGLTPYVTSDVMYYAQAGHGFPGGRPSEFVPVLSDACREVLETFPAVGGIILRIGECDANDVRGDFRSRLVIRTAGQARRLIQALLPVFRARERLLIFRTWTVGAYMIGDLMWNRRTFRRCFDGIDDDHFVLSIKHGESDFFRYLPLNRHFFRSTHRKIVELQARREYEGFGQYPSFIGWDYAGIREQLAASDNIAGISLWCQTGGWCSFRGRTFIEDSSLWNEINTFVTLKIFKDGLTPEEAVRQFAAKYLPGTDWAKLLALLRLSDEVVKELLYIDEFARRKIFFRRLRVPPLLSVFWDYVIITHSMRKILRCFVLDRDNAIHQGYAALRKIRSMQRLADELGLPSRGLAFQYDTFEILAAAREYYFGTYRPSVARRLKAMKRRYKSKYSDRYHVKLDFSRFSMPRSRLRRLMGLLLRNQRGYRLIDRILMIGAVSLFSPLLRMTQRRFMPEGLRRQAMGIDTILK